MQFDWSLFVCAVGLAFVFEGLVYVAGASRMPDLLRMLSERTPAELRAMGGIAVALGLALVYLARKLV